MYCTPSYIPTNTKTHLIFVYMYSQRNSCVHTCTLYGPQRIGSVDRTGNHGGRAGLHVPWAWRQSGPVRGVCKKDVLERSFYASQTTSNVENNHFDGRIYLRLLSPIVRFPVRFNRVLAQSRKWRCLSFLCGIYNTIICSRRNAYYRTGDNSMWKFNDNFLEKMKF